MRLMIGAGVLVARVDAVEVEHGDSAELAHRDRELDVHDAVHGGAPDRQRQLEMLAHREGDVDLVGVERDAAGDQRDLVESISAARPPADAYLQARLLPGSRFRGFRPALIQGVFTPMAAGFR